jgi:sulfur-oxidizing protein SoxY
MKKVYLLIFLISISLIAEGKNPLESPMFDTLIKSIVNETNYVFDNQNIIIKVPDFADNPVQVPIFVDGTKIKNAKRLILITDYNPIPNIIDIKLYNLLPIFSTNIKIAQGTPLRVLILDDKNIWHIGSKNIKSNGGGCDISSQISKNNEFEDFLGKIKIQLFDKDNSTKIKSSIFHPMETGLVFGTTEFYINKITLKTNNNLLAEMSLTQVISENPRFIFETKEKIDNLTINFFDINGNNFNEKIEK